MKHLFQKIDLFAHKRGWLRWHEGPARRLACPACRETSDMPSRLDTASPEHRFRRFALHECPQCGTGHFPGLNPPAYEGKKARPGERIRETAALKYYQEQGAGIFSMAAPLVPLAQVESRSFLEVGCGYGFALHFAREVLGWRVKGCDPSSLARVGAEDLGLDIEPLYLQQGTEVAGAPFDVVYASEVIEHVPDPDVFASTMHSFLAEDGILVLTTPDIGSLQENRPLDGLLPLVSPGSHLTLYSKSGLQAVLERAGFLHVRVQSSADTLIAYAANHPLPTPVSHEDKQERYMQYLQSEADRTDLTAALRDGFAGRLIKELGNAGEHEQVLTKVRDLFARWKRRYGLDWQHLPEMQLPEAEKGEFEEFALNIPFNLPVVLYQAGVAELNLHGNGGQARALFQACITANARLQVAYKHVNVVDLESMIMAGLAQALLIGLSANADPQTAAEKLLALDTRTIPPECAEAFFNARLDVFAAAANTGNWEAAEPFREEIQQFLQQNSISDARSRSAAAGLAMIALNRDFDRKTGLHWLNQALRTAPDEEPWLSLREVWAGHAAARGAELLGQGLATLARGMLEIHDGLLAAPPRPNQFLVLLNLGVALRRTEPEQALFWLERAAEVAVDQQLAEVRRYQTDIVERSFVQAVAEDDKIRAALFQEKARAIARDTAGGSLLLALGLDAMNRSGDMPAAIDHFTNAAEHAQDRETRAQALFHQALAMVRHGDAKTAKDLADQLFAPAHNDELPASIRNREVELRSAIGEGETTT